MRIAILRRLSRHHPHSRLLLAARRPRRHGVDRSRPGRRRSRGAAEGYGGAGADPGTHQDPRATAGASDESQADQPAQRLSAHRHRGLHPARHRGVVEPASRHPVLCRRRIDLGAGDRRDAADSPAGGRTQGRQMADRRRPVAASQDARHLRLRPDRPRRRRLRPRLRHEGGGVGARAGARPGACRRLRARRRARPRSFPIAT